MKAGGNEILVPRPCLLFWSRIFLPFVILQVGTQGDLEQIWEWGQSRKRVSNSFFSPACLVNVCLDVMSGRHEKSQQLGNGDTKHQFKVFSDSTLDFIKLDLHYQWAFEAHFRKCLEHLECSRKMLTEMPLPNLDPEWLWLPTSWAMMWSSKASHYRFLAVQPSFQQNWSVL